MRYALIDIYIILGDIGSSKENSSGQRPVARTRTARAVCILRLHPPFASSVCIVRLYQSSVCIVRLYPLFASSVCILRLHPPRLYPPRLYPLFASTPFVSSVCIHPVCILCLHPPFARWRCKLPPLTHLGAHKQAFSSIISI